MDSIGERIVQLRKAQNLSQRELGELVGVSFKTISNWERGVFIPPFKKVVKIAEVFEVNTKWLNLGEGAKNEKERELAQQAQVEKKN